MRISDWSSDVCSSDLTNNKHRVQTVAEMAGLKVRVQQSPSSVDFFESLNTNAIPMSWNQLYTALETNTVDGQENPIGTIHMAKLNDVQKYMTLTAHAYGAHVIVGSQKVWQSLSPKEKEIRSEEHTSELQSLMRISYAVFCLKKKNKYKI